MKIIMSNGINVELQSEKFTIIDKDGEVSLDSIYNMLMKNKGFDPNITDECFDDSVDQKIRDGLKMFITELFAKMKTEEFEV